MSRHLLLPFSLALHLLACGDRAGVAAGRGDATGRIDAATVAEPQPCNRDDECTGDWSPATNGCGPIERCFGGRCVVPPAVTGTPNGETGRLVFALPGGERAWHVEIQNDRFESARGMMCRTSMAPGWGMLFFMSETRPHRFWMKNTLIPLDMVFIGEDWKVAGVVSHAQPQTLDGRGVSAPSRYVLELPAGEALRAGIIGGIQARYEPPK